MLNLQFRHLSMSKCAYCGPKPISHFAVWLENSLAIVFYPLDKIFAGSFLERLTNKIGSFLKKPAFKILELIGALRYKSDLSQTKNLRVKVLFAEAKKRNIDMQGISLLNKDIDYYVATYKKRSIVFNGIPRPKTETLNSLWWMDDKKILKNKLQAAGLPVPQGESFSQFKPLINYFQTLEKPVVIKPRLGSRGRHTTTLIYTDNQLHQAYKVAKQLCYWVVVEEHILGSVYRGTVIGGKLVGILGGDPPRITGDGIHIIEELISIKNAQKPTGVQDFIPSLATDEFLARQKYNRETILPKNTTIDLSEKIGVSYGGTSFEVTTKTHPDFKKILERAAAIVGDPILGFDFIAEDISKPPENNKWGIIECNSLPFINLHHFPLIGEPVNVAGYIWDLWDKFH